MLNPEISPAIPNPNHPKLGDTIKVEPIRTVNAINKIKKALAPSPRNLALFSDHDGIPDDWELSNGLNPNDAKDRNVVAANGYTMLEKYLNSIDGARISGPITDNSLLPTIPFGPG